SIGVVGAILSDGRVADMHECPRMSAFGRELAGARFPRKPYETRLTPRYSPPSRAGGWLYAAYSSPPKRAAPRHRRPRKKAHASMRAYGVRTSRGRGWSYPCRG